MNPITVGTRGSLLAVEQAKPIVEFLESKGILVRWRKFTTQGDKWLSGPLEKASSTGLFTRELEESLLAGEVDLLIHSLKDVSLERPAGVVKACIPKRESALDLMILRRDWSKALTEMTPLIEMMALTLGTSSIRRERLLKEAFPNATFTWIRGNVPTRIQRVREGVLHNAPLHGTFLAAAGIQRLKLDLSDLDVRTLTLDELLPAPGQGAILAETRSDRPDIVEILSDFHHAPTATCVELERKVLAGIGGGCQQPLGVHASILEDGVIRLMAAFSIENGIRRWDGSSQDQEELLRACQKHLCGNCENQ